MGNRPRHPADPRFASLVFIVCLWAAMTLACGSRATPPAVPSSQPVSSSPERPTAPVPDRSERTGPTFPDVGSIDCALIPEPGEPIATVALGERVDPANAPHPSNEGERLLFRQLYETLVQVDCEGRVGPALAASWRLDGSGRTWVVTLRENARFSDGTPVTAADVRASWTRGTGDALRPQVSRLVQSIVPVDDRTLAITLRSARVDVPLVLAHTDLAIAKIVPDSVWPLGTRSTRVASDRDKPLVIATADNLSSIRFLVAPGDPRDLLDQGVDLLLTRDQRTLDYAATLPQFLAVPLAWQRTHVLLTPGRTRASRSLSDEERQALADDAVRGEARGAQGPFWWQALPDCEVAPPSNVATLRRDQSSPATPRIVYDGSDAAARDLAERLVGLVSASGPVAAATLDVLLPGGQRRAYQRATALTGDALALARRRGNDAGYVMSLDRRPLDPCRELQVVMEGARWLDPETIVPMVDTRLQAIVRRGRSGVAAEWDGGLLIAGAGRAR